MFVGRMSLNVGKVLRNIWLYKAHFDKPDSQPLRWELAWGALWGSSAQRKLLLVGNSVSPADLPSGGHTGALGGVATSPAADMVSWKAQGGTQSWLSCWLAQPPSHEVWEYLGFPQSCSEASLMGQKATPRSCHILEIDSDIPASPEGKEKNSFNEGKKYTELDYEPYSTETGSRQLCNYLKNNFYLCRSWAKNRLLLWLSKYHC